MVEKIIRKTRTKALFYIDGKYELCRWDKKLKAWTSVDRFPTFSSESTALKAWKMRPRKVKK